jgi:hypothetical protein
MLFLEPISTGRPVAHMTVAQCFWKGRIEKMMAEGFGKLAKLSSGVPFAALHIAGQLDAQDISCIFLPVSGGFHDKTRSTVSSFFVETSLPALG